MAVDPDAGRVQALLDRLGTFDEDASSVFPALLPELASLIAADTTLAYGFAIVDDEIVEPDFVEVHGHAADSAVAAFRAQFPARRKSASFYYDPVTPEPGQRNVALRLCDIPGRAARDCSFAAMARSMGHGDQLRILVCDGPSLLAWVGGLRAREFSVRERALLDALAQALRLRLSLERRLRDERVDAPLADLLRAIAAPAFLVDGRRCVAHANAAGRALLDLRGSAVASDAAQASAGPMSGWTAPVTILARGLPAYRLVIREIPAAPRFDVAASAWGLTARQRDVLRHLADGHANKTIAALLECATHTIELHVTEILRRAGAESRAALVAKMWREYGR